MDRCGAAPRPSNVQDMANILLAGRESTNIQGIGKNWVPNFIKRQDKLIPVILDDITTNVQNVKIQRSSNSDLTSYKSL